MFTFFMVFITLNKVSILKSFIFKCILRHFKMVPLARAYCASLKSES